LLGLEHDAGKIAIDKTKRGLAIKTCEPPRLRGGQISAEEAQNLAQLGLGNARVGQIPGFLNHDGTLAGARTALS
jgi:hypothetical protein